MPLKLFDRYMAGRFLKPFLFGLGVFALLIFLGDLFGKMALLAKSRAPFWVILQYLWLEVPYWAIRSIPMATLLATLYAVTGFVQSGEWIAVQATGFQARAFFRPILWMALGVTALSFAAQELVLPACHRRAQRLWRDQIHPEWEWDKYEDVVLMAGSDQFVTARLFRVREGLLERPVLDEYGKGGLIRQLDARSARWEEGSRRWTFEDGVERFFDGDEGIRESPFKRLDSGLREPPRALIPRKKNPDEMSLFEMRLYLRQARRLGASLREARAALHSKIAYPFANLVLCLLGIPLALRLRRASRALSFGLVLGVSFLYLFVMETGRALGMSGWMPAALAAWAPNLAFGAAAAWLYRRTEV